MTEQPKNGTYVARFELKPKDLMALLHAPPETRIRWVLWNEDRMSFSIILDMPGEERYFVPDTDTIPSLPVTVVRESGPDGEKLRIRIADFGEPDDKLTRRKARAGTRTRAQTRVVPKEPAV